MATSPSPPAQRATTREEEIEFSEVPPAIVCVICGRFDCAGCVEAPPAAPQTLLPWERDAGFWRPLTDTAIFVTRDPSAAFGQLTAARTGRAFTFALSVEALALGSVGLVLLGALALVAPRFVERTLSTWFGASVVFGLWVAAVAALLLVHVIWGATLELGARSGGARADWARGFRFGMYSCGWDLLTSPAGLLLCVTLAPRSSALGLAFAASRVPRRAVEAYLSECRALTTRARKRAVWTSTAVFGGGFLLFVAAIAWGLFTWLAGL